MQTKKRKERGKSGTIEIPPYPDPQSDEISTPYFTQSFSAFNHLARVELLQLMSIEDDLPPQMSQGGGAGDTNSFKLVSWRPVSGPPGTASAWGWGRAYEGRGGRGVKRVRVSVRGGLETRFTGAVWERVSGGFKRVPGGFKRGFRES